MKKAMVAVLVVALLIPALFTGCQGVVQGSGKLETREYDLSDFTRVEISSAFEFAISQADSYRVSVTADDNLFQHLDISRDGETLKIGLKTILSLGSATLQAEIAMPRLLEVDISGASSGTASGFSSTEWVGIEVSGASALELVQISAGDVRLDVSGASEVTGELTAGDADLDASGASTIQLEGSGRNLAADASGASHMILAGFTVNNADINLSGASSGTVNLDGRLDAELSGASTLEYMGEPAMGDINTSGASTLSKK